MGVACTDCHSPHASANVPQVVGISHFDVARPKRLPMSVNDPGRLLQVPLGRLRQVLAALAPPGEGRQDVLRRLPRCARSDGRQPASGNAQPVVLEVPRREAGPVRLRASAGDRELRDIAILRTARSPTTCCNNRPPSSACDAMSGTATATTAVAHASTSTPYLKSGQASTRTARRATPRFTVVTCRRHTSPACSGKVAADRAFNRVNRR